MRPGKFQTEWDGCFVSSGKYLDMVGELKLLQHPCAKLTLIRMAL